MEQSLCEISLRHPYMSEMNLPTFDTVKDTSHQINDTLPSAISSVNSIKSSSELLRTASIGRLVDCAYKAGGCTEKVPQGTVAEKEHHQTCQYRPIPCLMHHVCKQLVPYHNFLLHHMKHFIYPTFSTILNTSVVFEREDFDCNHRWQPRWMNCYDKEFFVMIAHKIPGMWYFWVWMLGTPEEAEEFSYDVEISKRHLKKAGTFPVLSFRTNEDELLKRDICLSMTDYQIKRISQIKNNLVGSMDIDLVIWKGSSSSISRVWLGGRNQN